MVPYSFMAAIAFLVLVACALLIIPNEIMALIGATTGWIRTLFHRPRVALKILWNGFWASWTPAVTVAVLLISFIFAPQLLGYSTTKLLFVAAMTLIFLRTCVVEEIHGKKESRRETGARIWAMVIVFVILSTVSFFMCGALENAKRGKDATFVNIWTASSWWRPPAIAAKQATPPVAPAPSSTPVQSPPVAPARSSTSSDKPRSLPSKQNEVPKPTPKADQTPVQKSGLELAVSLVGPADPAIVVNNQTDNLAEGITWELVMFRTTDQAFFSYATQNIGYVKAHSKSPPYTMQPNTLPHAPGGGQIGNGETFIGTLAVDCPSCRGTTLVVSFVWGSSGWFYEVPEGNGHLPLPKDMSKDTVSQFIESINAAVKPEKRTPIL